MREGIRRYGIWILLAAWLLCVGLAALSRRVAGQSAGQTAGAVGVEARTALRAKGETLPLRAFLPEEPVFWRALGLWRTHPALDTPGGAVTALRAGRVTRVWEDRLWGVCAEMDCGGETWVYRSLAQAAAREGDALARGDTVGVAGVAPIEEELGAHAHIERLSGDTYADPLGE